MLIIAWQTGEAVLIALSWPFSRRISSIRRSRTRSSPAKASPRLGIAAAVFILVRKRPLDRRQAGCRRWRTGRGSYYREPNLIERFFSKPKHFCRIASRYDKPATNFLAMAQLASMRLWLRAYEPTAQTRRYIRVASSMRRRVIALLGQSQITSGEVPRFFNPIPIQHTDLTPSRLKQPIFAQRLNRPVDMY